MFVGLVLGMWYINKMEEQEGTQLAKPVHNDETESLAADD